MYNILENLVFKDFRKEKVSGLFFSGCSFHLRANTFGSKKKLRIINIK
jgi:hypothetical protein